MGDARTKLGRLLRRRKTVAEHLPRSPRTAGESAVDGAGLPGVERFAGEVEGASERPRQVSLRRDATDADVAVGPG